MRANGNEPRTCAAALTRAFNFLGKRWSGVLLATLVQGPAGFAELKRAVAGISDSVLSDRLAELTRAVVDASAGPVIAAARRFPAIPRRWRITL